MAARFPKYKESWLSARDIVGIAAICITLLISFISWSRSDSARAQQLDDLSKEVQSVQQKVDVNNSSLSNRLDSMQNKIDLILTNVKVTNSN
jgi:hypothetical protein